MEEDNREGVVQSRLSKDELVQERRGAHGLEDWHASGEYDPYGEDVLAELLDEYRPAYVFLSPAGSSTVQSSSPNAALVRRREYQELVMLLDLDAQPGVYHLVTPGGRLMRTRPSERATTGRRG